MTEHHCQASRTTESYRSMPAIFLAGDPPQPAPFLMSMDELIRFFRLNGGQPKFPKKTIQRYRRKGLQSVRIGRRVLFRLDDALRFLDQQQAKL